MAYVNNNNNSNNNNISIKVASINNIENSLLKNKIYTLSNSFINSYSKANALSPNDLVIADENSLISENDSSSIDKNLLYTKLNFVKFSTLYMIILTFIFTLLLYSHLKKKIIISTLFLMLSIIATLSSGYYNIYQNNLDVATSSMNINNKSVKLNLNQMIRTKNGIEFYNKIYSAVSSNSNKIKLKIVNYKKNLKKMNNYFIFQIKILVWEFILFHIPLFAFYKSKKYLMIK